MTNEVVLTLDPSGEPIADDRAAARIIGEALEQGAGTVVIPIARLDPGFFDLRTGIAGQIVNKFAVYRIRLIVLGDVSLYERTSAAFHAFVREANRGHELWFVPTAEDLSSRMQSGG